VPPSALTNWPVRGRLHFRHVRLLLVVAVEFGSNFVCSRGFRSVGDVDDASFCP